MCACVWVWHNVRTKVQKLNSTTLKLALKSVILITLGWSPMVMMVRPCLSTAPSFTFKAFAGSSTVVVAYLCSADAVKFIIPAFMMAPEKHRSLLQDLRGRQALHDVKPRVFYWRRQPWPWAARCQGWLVTSGQDDPLRAQHPSNAVNSEMDHLNSQPVSGYLQQGSDLRDNLPARCSELDPLHWLYA